MKALMIMPDMLASSIPDAFIKAGFKVQRAESGVFALTMLERDRPDLIICTDFLGDMRGREMFDIVRSDPSLAEVVFILLDGTEGIPPTKKEVELSWMASPSDIVRTAKELVDVSKVSVTPQKPASEKLNTPQRNLQPEAKKDNPKLGSSRDTSIFQTETPMKPRNVGASGTLEIFTLFDLAVSLTANSKIGILHIRIVKEEGSIFFFKGRLTHAEFKHLKGEAALMAIFALADVNKNDTEFIFEPLDLETLPLEVSSIQTTVDKLLFNIAVELDHQREARNAKV